MGIQIPRGRNNFWGLSGPWKSIVSHCCGVSSKKINNVISGSAITAADCIAPDLQVSRKKSATLRCGLLSKFFEHLLLLLLLLSSC